MHTISFAAPRANMARTPSAARFGRWLVDIIRAREVLSAIPPEGSPCARDDEVDRASHLLLGRPDPRH
jgi:hypothetical protein